MKSTEFITESEIRELTFGELGQARKTVYMGDYTNSIGEFIDLHNVVVHQVGFDSIITVSSPSEPHIQDAHQAFDKFFDVSEIKNLGQSQYGFKFSVAHMDPGAYADDLENTLRYWNFTKK